MYNIKHPLFSQLLEVDRFTPGKPTIEEMDRSDSGGLEHPVKENDTVYHLGNRG
ncbi:hypothetical protein [Limosilactobacillus fermentum]